MKDLLKLNWINGLGISFIFTAFLYFLKIAADNGWLPPEVRAASGLALGATAIFSGLALFKKGKTYVAETISGLGIAMLYATLAYVSFSESIMWSPNAMLISMVCISITTCYIAIKSNMRILYLLSTIGGLITPLIIKAGETDDFMLFIYLFIINVAALYVSALKKWHELKIISFILSLAIYTTYYVLFDPIQWVKPLFYISVLFITYIIGLTISSWNQNTSEISINHYLEILNAINFVFWANLIFGEFEIPHTLPMVIVGIVFISLGTITYYFKDKNFNLLNGAYLALGTIVMAIACSDTGLLLKNGMNYVVNCGIWTILIAAAFIFGKKSKNNSILLGTYATFLIATTYWYTVAWDVEWLTIFGFKYIPFFNAGALIWISLAFLGFYFSKHELNNTNNKQQMIDNNILSITLAMISHIIVGGLLTVQISNLWSAYHISILNENLSMSICWIIYALTIYLWNNVNNAKVYKIFGASVLIITSLKVFFIDLSGKATFEKVIFLLIAGGLTLLIGKVSKPKIIE